MILDKNEFQKLEEFVAENAGTPLGEHAIYAQAYYRDTEDTEDYVVIKVKGFYAIAKIVDEWQPIEISNYVQPFDDTRVYPLQKIKKEIDFVY